MLNVTSEERAQLELLLHRGQTKTRVLTRARIVLKSAEGWSAAQIAQALEICPATVTNTRRRYQEGGIARVLEDRPPTPHARALDGAGEAVLIAVACSSVPDGHDHWTLRMLRGKLIELGVVEGISASTVQTTLKKMRSSPGNGNTGVCPRSMPHM